MSGLRGYDAWKTRSDLDDHEHRTRWNKGPYECDCCGKRMEEGEGRTVWAYGLETFACEKCLGDDEEEENQ